VRSLQIPCDSEVASSASSRSPRPMLAEDDASWLSSEDQLSIASSQPAWPQGLPEAEAGALVGIRALVHHRQQRERASSQPSLMPRRMRILQKCHEPRGAKQECPLLREQVAIPDARATWPLQAADGEEDGFAGMRASTRRHQQRARASSHSRAPAQPPLSSFAVAPLPRRLRIQQKCRGASSKRSASVSTCASSHLRGSLRRCEYDEHCDGSDGHDSSDVLPRCEQRKLPRHLQLPRLQLVGDLPKGVAVDGAAFPRILSSPRSFTAATGMRKPVSVVLAPLEASQGLCGKQSTRAGLLGRPSSAASLSTVSSACPSPLGERHLV